MKTNWWPILLLPNVAAAASAGIADVMIGGAIVGIMTVAAVHSVVLIVNGTKKIGSLAKPAVETLVSRGSEIVHDLGKSDEQKILDTDDAFFQQATDEVHENRQVSGLWLKAFSIANGHAEQQKATYVRLRAKQLGRESKK